MRDFSGARWRMRGRKRLSNASKEGTPSVGMGRATCSTADSLTWVVNPSLDWTENASPEEKMDKSQIILCLGSKPQQKERIAELESNYLPA